VVRWSISHFDQDFVDRGEDRVPRDRIELVVEGDVGPDELRVLPKAATLASSARFNRAMSFVGRDLGRLPGDSGFEQQPRLLQLFSWPVPVRRDALHQIRELAGGRSCRSVGDPCRVPLVTSTKPFCCSRKQGLAHRGAADAKRCASATSDGSWLPISKLAVGDGLFEQLDKSRGSACGRPTV